MGLSLTQAAPAAHRNTAEDRLERIGQLTTRQLTDALLWLAGYAPDVFDVVADAVEPFAGDGSEDPAPIWSCSSRGTGPSWPGALAGCPRSDTD